MRGRRSWRFEQKLTDVATGATNLLFQLRLKPVKLPPQEAAAIVAVLPVMVPEDFLLARTV